MLQGEVHVSLHDLEVRLIVSESAEPGPDHDEHRQRDGRLYFDQGSQGRCQPTEGKGGIEFEPVRAAFLGSHNIGHRGDRHFQQHAPALC
jgi:hypothetical protein